MKKPEIVAIIPARGGSKGIPKKNIIPFCGKPLIAWTIEQLRCTDKVHSVWVSSDSEEILEVGREYGAETILRPQGISGDKATSESAWLHGLDFIESKGVNVDVVLAPQVTSPLREVKDIDDGIVEFQKLQCDSMFSCSIAEDFFFWKLSDGGAYVSENYDYKNRKRRQDFPKQFIENGSFYLFKPEILKQQKNRLGGKIGIIEMDFWKMFEIDSMDDLRMCEALMNAFLLNK